MSNPISDPEVWHVATIAGRDTPGLAKVEGNERERAYDEKKGPGRDGATLTYRGKKLVELVLTIKIWTADMYDAWEDFRAFLEPYAEEGKAVTFWHGSTETLHVKSVVITNIGNPKQVTEGDSLYVATIKMKEWIAPPKANVTKTPAGAQADGGAGAPRPTALTQSEQDASNLLAEARRIS